ncbi:MAG: class I SAM-dependent methyltransferase [Prosthecobacter sp.]
MPPQNAKERFSNRVADYVRYRPGYPAGLIDVLRDLASLHPGTKVADVGSGTGISAALLLDAGCEVFAVEPNADMRHAAEVRLGANPRFHSIGAPAEVTTLRDQSVELVLSAQAFHWFDVAKSRAEFSRILVPGGFIALVWNVRQTDSTPFLRDYEALLETYATDYAQVRHENVNEAVLRGFFAEGSHQRRTLPNAQHFDFAGLRGRLLSSSYAPAEGQPGHDPMMQELRRIFDANQRDGAVDILYDTEIHIGR